MKTVNTNKTENTMEIKKNYATPIKGEAILGVKIELSSADIIAMEQLIYGPMDRKIKATKLLEQSGLNVWDIPEGMTKDELKSKQEQYAKDNGYDSWQNLRSFANWRFDYIQEELETFFSKIRVQHIETVESTLFIPIINEDKE